MGQHKPRIRYESDGPTAYANRLSSYIKDPVYIRNMTVREYGKAPPLPRIERMMERHRKSKEAFERGTSDSTIRWNPENDNGEHFQVRGLVKARKEVRREPARHIESETDAPLRLSDSVRPSAAVIRAVADWFGIEPEDVCSRSRKSFVVSARFVAVRLMVDMRFEDGSRRYTYPMIGNALGGRDHSTVVHAVATFDYRAKKFPEMLEAYEALKDG